MNTNYIENGYILMARQIQYSEIWKKPSDWMKVFLYILQEVNHKDNKQFVRGENFFNAKEMARECYVTQHTVHHFIKWAKSATLIATRKTTRGIVISVVNYAKYQSPDNYKSDTKSDTYSETEAKQKRNRSDTINKNDNNDNNEKNVSVVGSQSEPTPNQIALKFFSDEYYREEFIQKAIAKGMEENLIRAEIKKFCAYWTERTLTGKKERWQTEKVFEIRRRLATWLNLANKSFNSSPHSR